MHSNLVPPDLDEEAEQAFLQEYQHCENVRERIATIFHNKLNSSIRSDESVADMEKPNWDLRQADRIGYRRACREIINYLDQEVTNE